MFFKKYFLRLPQEGALRAQIRSVESVAHDLNLRISAREVCHVVFLWCYVCFAFLFVSVCLLSLKPRPFIQYFFVLWYTGSPTAITRFFMFSSFFRGVAFPGCFCTTTVFFLYGECIARFPLSDGVFLPCDQGLFFFTSSSDVIFQLINQSKAFLLYTAQEQD